MSHNNPDVSYRPLPPTTQSEVFLPFLDLCVNWSLDSPRIGTDELLSNPDLSFYIEDWGRHGDIALAAFDQEEQIIGVAWLRLPDGERTGYGWVASDIPELSLAVLPEYQSQGIGSTLLDSICELARMSGFAAVSLSVEDGNGAAHLYHDRGFTTVGRNGESDIQILKLG